MNLEHSRMRNETIPRRITGESIVASLGAASATPGGHSPGSVAPPPAPTWVAPDDLDVEIARLCEALNWLIGIHTTSSCCGHGLHPVRVFLDAESLEVLVPVAYYVQWCHSGVQGWRLLVGTDCAMSPVHFLIEGPTGDYEGANKIAERLLDFLDTSDEPRPQ